MGLNTDINFSAIAEEFKGISINEPENWTLLPKVTFSALLLLIILGLGWYFYISPKQDDLEMKQRDEANLKRQFQEKSTSAASIDALKKQKIEVTQRVASLERQLPSKTEMDALLSDVNHAGIARGLQFELFHPEAAVLKQHFAEIPVSIKLQGAYHNIAQFAADVAALPRIVTLNNLSLVANKDGQMLAMESRAKAYRLLDEAEQKTEQEARAKAAKEAKGAKKS